MRPFSPSNTQGKYSRCVNLPASHNCLLFLQNLHEIASVMPGEELLRVNYLFVSIQYFEAFIFTPILALKQECYRHSASSQLSRAERRGGHKDNPKKAAAKITQNICKLDNKNMFGTFTFGITTTLGKNNKRSLKDPCKWLFEGSRDSLSSVEQSNSLLVPSGARHC